MNKSLKMGMVAVAIIILGVAAYCLAVSMDKSYYAVSTANGQFFVGRISHKPFTNFIKLDNPFILQNVQGADQKTVTPQLVDLSVESYWLPKVVFIHIDNIVSKGEVSSESLIATKIEEYKAAAQ